MTHTIPVLDDECGALISDHPHPRPALRQVTAGLAALGLIGNGIGVIGLTALGAIYNLPLLPLAAVFLLMLCPPLVLLTTLHPHVTVYENGLWVRPLLWRGCWITWNTILSVEDHTLIQRGTTKAHQMEHFGQIIVVQTGLSWPFLAVGIMAGLGRVRAFGISTHGHSDYETLRSAILARI